VSSVKMASNREGDKKTSKRSKRHRRNRNDDSDEGPTHRKKSLVDYTKISDRHVDDTRFEKLKGGVGENGRLKEQDTPGSSSGLVGSGKVSSQMDAVIRLMTGQEERTIAEKLADSNRPTWEQYKKDNADKLDIAGEEKKKMAEYRRELDKERDERLKRGTNHGSKKDRDHSRSSDSSGTESDDSDSSRGGRHHKKASRKKKKHKRKSKKRKHRDDKERKSSSRRHHDERRRRHHHDDSSDSSDNNSERSDERDRRKKSSSTRHKKKKSDEKKSSKSSKLKTDGIKSDDAFRLSSFFTKSSDEE